MIYCALSWTDEEAGRLDRNLLLWTGCGLFAGTTVAQMIIHKWNVDAARERCNRILQRRGSSDDSSDLQIDDE
jgi:hypothetical protein